MSRAIRRIVTMLCRLLGFLLLLVPLSFQAMAEEVVDAGGAIQSVPMAGECESLRAELRKKNKEIWNLRQELAYQRYRAEKGQQLYESLTSIQEFSKGRPEGDKGK
jgi:hypothetical protein